MVSLKIDVLQIEPIERWIVTKAPTRGSWGRGRGERRLEGDPPHLLMTNQVSIECGIPISEGSQIQVSLIISALRMCWWETEISLFHLDFTQHVY